jgi:LysM repeat protein
LNQALASGDPAAILAAQQAQTDAASKLADAQAAVTAATPTPDQLAAQAQAQQQLTAARQAYNAAVQASSASGVAGVLAQFQASEQQFVKDLNTLKKAGAGQELITQLAGMGADAGDALAQGLINDPKSLAAISKSMDAINNIAGQESDKLAQGYYGAGVKSMQQLLKGIEKQFPSLVKGLAPLAAQLAALFTFTPTVAGTSGSAVGGKTVTTDALHQLGTVAKQYGTTVAALIAANPSLKGDTTTSAIKKGTHLTIPAFASGVTDFGPGLAYVHKDEVLVNFPSAHNSVIPANRTKGGAPFGDTSGIERRLDALNAQVSTLAQDIGQVQAQVGAGLYVQAGQRQAKELARIGRKR